MNKMDQESGTSRVVAAAALAGGLVSSGLLLVDRLRATARAGGTRSRGIDATTTALGHTETRVQDGAPARESESRAAVERIPDRSPAATSDDTSSPTPDHSSPAHDAGGAASDFARMRRRARDVFEFPQRRPHEVMEHTMDQARQVGEQTAANIQAIATQAATAAVARAEQALARGALVASHAKEQFPVRPYDIGEELLPQLGEVAHHAAVTALELWHGARERTTDMARVEAARSAARASHAVKVGRDKARETTHAVAERAADTAVDLGERALDASSRTAIKSVRTGRETVAFCFWAGAAASLIFFVLLSPDRRDAVLKTIRVIISEFRGMIQDTDHAGGDS